MTSGLEAWKWKVKVLVAQLCPTLCDPTDCSPPGSSVHGTLQARILEWIAIPFSRGFSWLRDGTWVPCITGVFFTVWAIREAHLAKKVQALVAQFCPTLWDLTDCSWSGSSVHGLLQAGVLEWVAIPFSRGSFRPRDPTQVPSIAGRFFTIWATREAPITWRKENSRQCVSSSKV